MLRFNVGDIFAAYLKKRGYVGIGKILERAKPVRSVDVGEIPLLTLPLRAQHMNDSVESDEDCEYVCKVEWKKSVGREEAKWESHANLFTSQLVTASLDGQPDTIAYLEREFGILSLRELVT